MRQLRSDYLAGHQEDASYYVQPQQQQQQQHPWDEADEELPIDVVGGIAGSDSLDNSHSHSLSSTFLHQRSCQDDSCDGEGSAVIKLEPLEPLEPPLLHVPRKAQYNSSFSIESLLGT